MKKVYTKIILFNLLVFLSVSAEGELQEFFTFRQIRGTTLQFEVDNKTGEFTVQQKAKDEKEQEVLHELLAYRFPYKSYLLVIDNNAISRFNANCKEFKVVQDGAKINVTGIHENIQITETFSLEEGPLKDGGKNTVKISLSLKNTSSEKRKLGAKFVFNLGKGIGASAVHAPDSKETKSFDFRGDLMPEFTGVFNKDNSSAFAVLLRSEGEKVPELVRVGPYSALNVQHWDLKETHSKRGISAGNASVAVYFFGEIDGGESMNASLLVGGIGSGILELPQLREIEKKKAEEEERKALEAKQKAEEEKRKNDERKLNLLSELQTAVRAENDEKASELLDALKRESMPSEISEYYENVLAARKKILESKKITEDNPRYQEYEDARQSALKLYKEKKYTAVVKSILKMLEVAPCDTTAHKYMTKNSAALTDKNKEQLRGILLRRATEAKDNGDCIAAQALCALLKSIDPEYKRDERSAIENNCSPLPEGYADGSADTRFTEKLNEYLNNQTAE